MQVISFFFHFDDDDGDGDGDGDDFQGIYELWGEGEDMADLQRSIQSSSADKMAPWCSHDISFKVAVDGWGQALTQEQQVELIEQLAFLPLKVRCVAILNPPKGSCSFPVIQLLWQCQV